MTLKNLTYAAAATLIVLLGGCTDDGANGADGVDGAAGPAGPAGVAGPAGPAGANAAISLKYVGSTPAVADNFDESASEIVAYHAGSQTAFLVNSNAKGIDVVNLADVTAPTITLTLEVASAVERAVPALSDGDLGNVNSVDVYGDHMAVAIEADVKQETGYIAFYNVDGTFVSAVAAGALPDKVGFSTNGQYVLVANEGEPNDDHSVDPVGSITVIDVSVGFDIATPATAAFTAFNADGTQPT